MSFLIFHDLQQPFGINTYTLDYAIGAIIS